MFSDETPLWYLWNSILDARRGSMSLSSTRVEEASIIDVYAREAFRRPADAGGRVVVTIAGVSHLRGERPVLRYLSWQRVAAFASA